MLSLAPLSHIPPELVGLAGAVLGWLVRWLQSGPVTAAARAAFVAGVAAAARTFADRIERRRSGRSPRA